LNNRFPPGKAYFPPKDGINPGAYLAVVVSQADLKPDVKPGSENVSDAAGILGGQGGAMQEAKIKG
jgi:hypothetical protein